MGKKKLVFVLGFLLVGLIVTGIGYATEKGRRPHGYRHHEGTMEGCRHEGDRFHHNIIGCILRIKDKIGLNDDQITKLRSLKSEVKKQSIRDEAEMKVARIELRALVHQDKVDLKAIDAKIEEMGNLYTKMKKNRIYSKLDARKILTADQLKKFRELVKDGKCKKGER